MTLPCVLHATSGSRGPKARGKPAVGFRAGRSRETSSCWSRRRGEEMLIGGSMAAARRLVSAAKAACGTGAAGGTREGKVGTLEWAACVSAQRLTGCL